MSNVTDAAISSLISDIQSEHGAYFDSMDTTLQDLKEVKKGAPIPQKWTSPAVYVMPKRTVRTGMSETRVTAEILYLLKSRDPVKLGMSIAKGADALVDLIRDRFSLTQVETEFDYGLTEVSSEAAARITAEVIT
jgi:hypothetical protein